MALVAGDAQSRQFGKSPQRAEREGACPLARNAPHCRGQVEAVGAELAKAQLVEHRGAVGAGVPRRIAEGVDRVWKIEAAAVVAGVHAVAGLRASKFAHRLDVVAAPGDAFGEQRERALDVDQRRQGQTTSTMPATASCTLASSETACTMARSAARRGSMPFSMSAAA